MPFCVTPPKMLIPRGFTARQATPAASNSCKSECNVQRRRRQNRTISVISPRHACCFQRGSGDDGIQEEGEMKGKLSSEERRRNEALNRMLRDRRAEIEGRMRSLRQVIPSQDADVKDAEEQSMEDFVRDMDVALMVTES